MTEKKHREKEEGAPAKATPSKEHKADYSKKPQEVDTYKEMLFSPYYLPSNDR